MILSNYSTLSKALCLRNAQCLTASYVRSQSTKPKDLVLVDVNDKTGIATVTMNRLPVNSLSLELLTSMNNALEQLKKDNSRGMILTSGAKTVFSAGIDINEMYKPDPKRMRDFWSMLQEVWINLYGSPFPTAAAINGHSPAGGCLLAMCCEYRVMLPKFTIGLNETQLGIIAPPWFMDTMKNTISLREAELALTLGKMFKTDEALRIGLIDEVASDKAEALAKCEAFLLKQQKTNQDARYKTKMLLRGDDIRKLADARQFDVDRFVGVITQKKIQKDLGLYVTVLKVRSFVKSLTKPFGSIMKMFGGKSKKSRS